MQSILFYIRDILTRIFSKQASTSYFNVSSIDSLISEEMEKHFILTENLYENNTEYIDWLRSGQVKSLRLPSVLSREVTRTVCSEAKIYVDGTSERAKYLNEQLKIFMRKFPVYVEQAIAFGNMAFKPYISGDNILASAVRIGDFIPVKVDGQGVFTSCIFAEKLRREDGWYTRIEYHHSEDGTYTVENSAYRSGSKGGGLGTQVALSSVPEWKNYQNVVTISGSDLSPLYAVYSNPFANSIDVDSPLGVSLYADSIDLIKEADELWEETTYEMKSGERKVFGANGIFKMSNGIDYTMSRFYKQVNFENDGALQEFSPALRNDFMSARLQDIFKRIEQNAGLSFGVISDPQSVDKTATEVIHSKRRYHETIESIQTALTGSIEQLVSAMNRMCDLYGIVPSGEYSVVCDWDDSVLESKDEKRALAMQEYQMGLIDEAEYFMETRGYSKDEAIKLASEIRSRSQAQQAGRDWFKDREGA